MPGLRLVRGTVIEAKSFMVSEVTTVGTGDDARVSSRATEYQEIWLQLADREFSIKAPATTAFRAGHLAVFVLRDRQVLFSLNETTGNFGVLRSRLVRFEGFVCMTAFLTFIAGMFGVMLMGGGAPIGHIVVPMLLCPIPVALWAWRARRRVLAECWALTGADPS